jgi:hypothetical protein
MIGMADGCGVITVAVGAVIDVEEVKEEEDTEVEAEADDDDAVGGSGVGTDTVEEVNVGPAGGRDDAGASEDDSINVDGGGGWSSG